MKRLVQSPAIRQVLADYWQQYKTFPLWTAIAFLAPALGSICIFFAPPLIVARLINAYVAEGSLSFRTAGPFILLFAGIWYIGELLWRLGFYYLTKFKEEGIRRLSRLAFTRLTDRDYHFYTDHFVGSLTKKAAAFVRSFEIFTDTLNFSIFNNVFPILFAIVILWRYSPWIPLVLVVCIAIVIAVALPIIRRRSVLVAERHAASSAMVGRLADTLTNMPAVKSFAKEDRERRIYDTYVKDYATKFKRAADFQNLRFDMAVSPLYVGTNVVGLLLTIFLAERLQLAPGAMVVIFTYYAQITRIFWEVNRIYRDIESSVGEAAEFAELFLAEPLIQDVSGAKSLKVMEGAVAFTQVNFSYHGKPGKETFLRKFNLDIPANQKVGLVGPSGGGKTTITRLLLRFLDVQGGSITIDGQDISRVTQESLREAIAYVPQEPLLFHRTLFENIAYGNDRATKREVMQAAKIAHADEFIAKLPQGFDTLVGERGIKLSGGQRQRVAIARALLKKSTLLILDEATSSLDSESEKYIQDGLAKLMKNKTALVIAHRLSTIRNLDRIIVLDNGKIVQDGSHDELIRQPGLYAKLWSHQSGEFLSS